MLKTVLEADEEIQVALRAGADLIEQNAPGARVALQECFSKFVAALERHEQCLGDAKNNFACILEADLQWKTALLDAVPPMVTAEQLRALFFLVKARPFLQFPDDVD